MGIDVGIIGFEFGKGAECVTGDDRHHVEQQLLQSQRGQRVGIDDGNLRTVI